MKKLLPTLAMCLSFSAAKAAEEVNIPIHFWMKAFIPNELLDPPDYIKRAENGLAVIPAPLTIGGYNIGPLSGTCFASDNRGFDTRPDASARVSIEFNLVFHGRREISLEKYQGKEMVRVGETHNVDCTSGKDLSSPRKEDVSSVDVGEIRKNGFLRIFNVKGVSGNPFYRVLGIGLAPKIDIETVFEYNPLTLSLSLHGVIGKFPAFEAYYNAPDTDTKTLLRLDPERGSTALNLLDMNLGINMRNFDIKVDLKPYLLPSK